MFECFLASGFLLYVKWRWNTMFTSADNVTHEALKCGCAFVFLFTLWKDELHLSIMVFVELMNEPMNKGTPGELHRSPQISTGKPFSAWMYLFFCLTIIHTSCLSLCACLMCLLWMAWQWLCNRSEMAEPPPHSRDGGADYSVLPFWIFQ